MTRWTVEIYQPQTNDFINQATTRYVARTMVMVLNRSVILAPVDTGLLRSRMQMRMLSTVGLVRGEVFNDTDYAMAVHDGSAAHTVRARRRQALRFRIGGQFVYARSARIPARRGRPFIFRALNQVADRRGFDVERVTN